MKAWRLRKMNDNLRRNRSLAKSGTIFEDIRLAWIHSDAMIGKDVYIGPCVTIGPGVQIGNGCRIDKGSTVKCSVIGDGAVIGEGSILENMKVGKGTSILKSVLKNSEIGSNCNIGPFAYIRPDCVIGDNVRLGDFVEIKNSSIGDNTKVSHLTYVGDSDLGKGINVGCGVVFVNYDGRDKFRSMVHDGVFIGCNVNIISPVEIGENAYIAAGTTITSDVPAGSLEIGRARQEHHEGWVEKKGLLQKDL